MVLFGPKPWCILMWFCKIVRRLFWIYSTLYNYYTYCSVVRCFAGCVHTLACHTPQNMRFHVLYNKNYSLCTLQVRYHNTRSVIEASHWILYRVSCPLSAGSNYHHYTFLENTSWDHCCHPRKVMLQYTHQLHQYKCLPHAAIEFLCDANWELVAEPHCCFHTS